MKVAWRGLFLHFYDHGIISWSGARTKGSWDGYSPQIREVYTRDGALHIVGGDNSGLRRGRDFMLKIPAEIVAVAAGVPKLKARIAMLEARIAAGVEALTKEIET